MEYRNDISPLGFGCMRLPKSYKESEKLVLHAIENGINYFDTAYIYPGNETLLGKILESNNCRDKVKIATKLPHYLVKTYDDFEKYFQIELKRLRTTHVDYYLIHMLPDTKTWGNLNAIKWIEEKKTCGQIKKIGFSYHGNTDNFIKLIDAYPWDFAMVQYNYIDETSQAGRKGVEYAYSKNIPIFIMEPLRGGLLANGIPEKALRIINKKYPKASPAQIGLRWLWNQDSVNCVLSGMNSLDMIDENIRIATLEKEPIDVAFYENIKNAINEKISVPCTGCAYCMPCPFGVNIPGTFRCLNSTYIDGYFRGFREYIMTTIFSEKPTNASLCVSCGKCLPHCPQSINIPKEMKMVQKRLENPIFHIAKWVIKKKMHRKK